MSNEKKAISVAEMARLVGLSRTRFYQLVGSAFPHPRYDLATKRPYYTPELQQICLDVRRSNLGIDGKPVLFHRRQGEVSPVRPERSKRKPDDNRYKDLLGGLRSLGLAGVTVVDVEKALKELHVSDPALKDNGGLLKAVFLRLKGQDVSATSPKKKEDDHHDVP